MSFIKNNIITDCRGTLSYTQNNELPFDIKRIFYLTNLSSTRGGHSHYKCEQILYCINGSCDLYCSNGNTENRFIINNTSGGFYTPNNHWLEITNFNDNCIILVLCSHDRSAIKEFCNKILVLNNGKQEYFGSIEDGYKIYDKLMSV